MDAGKPCSGQADSIHEYIIEESSEGVLKLLEEVIGCRWFSNADCLRLPVYNRGFPNDHSTQLPALQGSHNE